jgi:hypothetical protein
MRSIMKSTSYQRWGATRFLETPMCKGRFCRMRRKSILQGTSLLVSGTCMQLRVIECNCGKRRRPLVNVGMEQLTTKVSEEKRGLHLSFKATFLSPKQYTRDCVLCNDNISLDTRFDIVCKRLHRTCDSPASNKSDREPGAQHPPWQVWQLVNR